VIGSEPASETAGSPFRIGARITAGCVGGADETTLVLSLGDEVVAVAKSTRGRESLAVLGWDRR
jgi:hypothetical protein